MKLLPLASLGHGLWRNNKFKFCLLDPIRLVGIDLSFFFPEAFYLYIAKKGGEGQARDLDEEEKFRICNEPYRA